MSQQDEYFSVAESKCIAVITSPASDQSVIDALTSLIDERIARAMIVPTAARPQPENVILCAPEVFEAIKNEAERSFQEQVNDRGNKYTGVSRPALAQVAHEAWRTVVPSCAWEDLCNPDQEAWQAAAAAVVRANNERSVSTGPAIEAISKASLRRKISDLALEHALHESRSNLDGFLDEL